MDGGALVVTVLIAVLDREMHVHVDIDVDILGLDRSDLEAAAFNDKVSPSQPTHETTKKKSNVA
jgi:hypothetical protein